MLGNSFVPLNSSPLWPDGEDTIGGNHRSSSQRWFFLTSYLRRPPGISDFVLISPEWLNIQLVSLYLSRQYYSCAVFCKQGLWLVCVCVRAVVSWRCCPGEMLENEVLRTPWWTPTEIKVVNECGSVLLMFRERYFFLACNLIKSPAPLQDIRSSFVFVQQGYETPCSDKPPSLTLWTESVTKNHPWPCSNILFFINTGFLACVSLCWSELDSHEQACSLLQMEYR